MNGLITLVSYAVAIPISIAVKIIDKGVSRDAGIFSKDLPKKPSGDSKSSTRNPPDSTPGSSST